ncbi:hypothetical protein TSMEX_004177 [Taenia solium]|eukprot:TsM_001011600 transcript=TsM_001011600 gene=TsM_001011600
MTFCDFRGEADLHSFDMHLSPFIGTLLLVALLSVSTLSYSLSLDPIIDCMMGELLKYAQENGEKFNVLGIGNLVRSCPFALNKTARDGKPTYTVGICFNVTRLALAHPSGISPPHFKCPNL